MPHAAKPAYPIRFILGIDPGAHGALVLLDALEPHTFCVWDMPTDDQGVNPTGLVRTMEEVVRIVANVSDDDRRIRAVVENVGSRPRQAGAFAFGLYTGILHGVLASFAIPFELVPPSVWKPAMGLRKLSDETQAQNKDRARMTATELFPQYARTFSRKKDDGRAEALLLALYYHHKRK